MFEKRNPFYFSPELLNIYLRKNPNYINLKKSDVFAYGVMAFEAFFDGLTPFLYPMQYREIDPIYKYIYT